MNTINLPAVVNRLMPSLVLDAGAWLQIEGDMHGNRGFSVADAHAQLPLHSANSVRADLYRLQAAAGELPEVECPLLHQFAPGVYMRTIFIPEGTIIVGKIHKHAHPNILSKGIASLLTEGGGVETITGPLTIISPPGTKRGLFAHTDLVWTTIHLTNSTDLKQIEEEVIAKTYDDYQAFLNGGVL